MDDTIHIVQNLGASDSTYDSSGWRSHSLAGFGHNQILTGVKNINRESSAYKTIYKDNRNYVEYSDSALSKTSGYLRSPEQSLKDIDMAFRSYFCPSAATIFAANFDALLIIQFLGKFYSGFDANINVPDFDSQGNRDSYYAPELDRQLRSSIKVTGRQMFSKFDFYKDYIFDDNGTIKCIQTLLGHLGTAKSQATVYSNEKLRGWCHQALPGKQGTENLIRIAKRLVKVMLRLPTPDLPSNSNWRKVRGLKNCWQSHYRGDEWFSKEARKSILSEGGVTINSADFWNLPGVREVCDMDPRTKQSTRDSFVTLLAMCGYFDLWERTTNRLYRQWLRDSGKPPTFQECVPVSDFYARQGAKFDPCQVSAINQDRVNVFLARIMLKRNSKRGKFTTFSI